MIARDRRDAGSLAQHLRAAFTCDPSSDEGVTIEAEAGFIALAECIVIYRHQNTKR